MVDQKAVMKIFAGPPGTGKTWSAAREAVRLLEPELTTDDELRAAHQRLVAEGRIVWVTFHPSYSYEDFVEGYRPRETETGGIAYSVVPGPFLRACATASAAVTAGRFVKGQKLGPRDNYEVADVDVGGVLLKSSVRRKDKLNTEDTQYVPFYLLRVFEAAGITPADLRHAGSKSNTEKGGKKKAASVDTATEAVGAVEVSANLEAEVDDGTVYEKHDGEGYSARQEVSRKTGLAITFFTNASPHAAVYEYLKEASHKSIHVVLVIDEINRADLSRVFGELITLLEFDKRQGAPEERYVTLAYRQQPFAVPPTLSIIGTMNTADRSLSSIDLALRRRFEFIFVPPDPGLLNEAWGGINIRTFFRAMNSRLAFIGGGENLVGHADYMGSKLTDLGEREGFRSDEDGKLRAFAQTVRTKTLPFLVDLFRSDWGRVGAVLGTVLFDRIAPPEDLPEEYAEAASSDSAGILQPAAWWDPGGAKWDAARFRKSLTKHAAKEEAPSQTEVPKVADPVEAALTEAEPTTPAPGGYGAAPLGAD